MADAESLQCSWWRTKRTAWNGRDGQMVLKRCTSSTTPLSPLPLSITWAHLGLWRDSSLAVTFSALALSWSALLKMPPSQKKEGKKPADELPALVKWIEKSRSPTKKAGTADTRVKQGHAPNPLRARPARGTGSTKPPDGRQSKAPETNANAPTSRGGSTNSIPSGRTASSSSQRSGPP